MPTFLVPETLLQAPPTKAEPGVEANNRMYGCEIIAQGCVLLQVSQMTICSAQLIFHRFYFRQSMKDYNILPTALAAVFLATKIEERPRKPRDIVNVFHRVLQLRKRERITTLDPDSDPYHDLRTQMFERELVVLRELGYLLYADHPHKYLMAYLPSFATADKTRNKRFAQSAWNCLSDAMRTTLPLRYPPEILACAALNLASRLAQVALPISPPWYELFDCSEQQLNEASALMADLHGVTRVRYIPLDEDDAKTSVLIEPEYDPNAVPDPSPDLTVQMGDDSVAPTPMLTDAAPSPSPTFMDSSTADATAGASGSTDAQSASIPAGDNTASGSTRKPSQETRKHERERSKERGSSRGDRSVTSSSRSSRGVEHRDSRGNRDHGRRRSPARDSGRRDRDRSRERPRVIDDRDRDSNLYSAYRKVDRSAQDREDRSADDGAKRSQRSRSGSPVRAASTSDANASAGVNGTATADAPPSSVIVVASSLRPPSAAQDVAATSASAAVAGSKRSRSRSRDRYRDRDRPSSRRAASRSRSRSRSRGRDRRHERRR